MLEFDTEVTRAREHAPFLAGHGRPPSPIRVVLRLGLRRLCGAGPIRAGCVGLARGAHLSAWRAALTVGLARRRPRGARATRCCL